VTAIDNARGYNWSDWLIGIMRSFLSGGAAALVTGGGGAIAGITAKQQYIMMASSFLGLGLYRMGEFLTLHGAPDKVQETLNVAEGKAKEAVAAVQEAQKAATPIDKQ
jgi:hypothetical protein